MGFIPEEIVERIKNENDIVDYINEKVPLKKSGSNYWGLCPFHGEKTPSFSVNREKQIYKCFGCGEGGNVISFVMAMDNLTFPEAVKKLAQRCGIKIPEEGKARDIDDFNREKIENMNRESALFFYNNLKDSKVCRDYLYKRQISPEIQVKFGLGFSLDSWDSLKDHLTKKGYKEEDLKMSGLFGQSEKGRIYDRFRNRLMFPVSDHRGRVIGFGARVFDDSKPKYLNSPETLLFKKGTNLYGLYQYIKGNNKEDYLIICEGYMDCIAMHQAGITNSVASLGTALTQNQARLIKKYVKKVLVSFDADEAGQIATLRGLEVLLKEGLEVRILTIDDGKDPDDFIKAHGKDAFIKLIDNALSLTEYKIKLAKKSLDLRKDVDKIKFFSRIKPLFTAMDPVARDVYINKISEEINVTRESIYQSLGIRQGSPNTSKEGSREEVNILKGEHLIESGQLRAERYLLKVLMDNKEGMEDILEEEFALESHKRIFNLFKEGLTKGQIVNSFNDRKDYSEYSLIEAIDDIPEDIPVNVLIGDFRRSMDFFNKKRKRAEILKEVARLEKIGQTEESLKLAKKLIELE